MDGRQETQPHGDFFLTTSEHHEPAASIIAGRPSSAHKQAEAGTSACLVDGNDASKINAAEAMAAATTATAATAVAVQSSTASNDLRPAFDSRSSPSPICEANASLVNTSAAAVPAPSAPAAAMINAATAVPPRSSSTELVAGNDAASLNTPAAGQLAVPTSAMHQRKESVVDPWDIREIKADTSKSKQLLSY